MSNKNKLEETFLKIMYEMPEHVFIKFVITYCDQNNICLDDLFERLSIIKSAINTFK